MKKFLFTLLILTSISCQKENGTVDTSSADIDLITGMEMTEITGTPIGSIGNPNVLNDAFAIYPNPTNEEISILSLDQSDITDCWIIKGNTKKMFQDIDFDNVLHSNLYTENELDGKALKLISDLEHYSIKLNLSDFESGHYRLFIKINGDIKWDNIYILRDNESYLDLFDTFWK